ncbi:TPA: hypothetical protein ACH3X2_005035 [Trebouxia sp. C0005]
MEDQKFADKKRARSNSNGSTSSNFFNAAEANRFLSDRWKQANARASDLKIPIEDRPQIYKAPPSTGSAWGKPSLHLQCTDGKADTPDDYDDACCDVTTACGQMLQSFCT